MTLNREQSEILRHTEHCAAGGLYCGGGKEMDALVASGLMESAGRKSFVPDEYFRITSAGRAALRMSPPPRFICAQHGIEMRREGIHFTPAKPRQRGTTYAHSFERWLCDECALEIKFTNMKTVL